jgi:hypothetical protein
VALTFSRRVSPTLAAVAGFACWLGSATAGAQGIVRDQSGTISSAPAAAETPTWWRRFKGSYVELSTYVGSGTFYASGYRNPYVSNAVYLRPSFQLGTKYGLSLNARVYIEEEYTQEDNPEGRRFYPLDVWAYLQAKNLYTAERSKIRFSGVLRAVVPASYESAYAHLVTGVAVGLAANRGFEFGRPDNEGKKWGLALSLGTGLTKYFRTSPFRGTGPADTSGCRIPSGAPPASRFTGPDGQPTTSEGDRCGGPLSTSTSVMTSASSSLSRRRWSFSATLLVINEFKYTFPVDQFTAMNATPGGRADWTWAILAIGYDLTDHFGLSAGLSSYQPALNAQATNVRFPFFDFEGGNANNYTQLFVSLNGTL